MVAASLSIVVLTGAWGVVCVQKEARFALAMWTLTKNTDRYISILYINVVVHERRFTDFFKSNENSESTPKKRFACLMSVRSVF